MPGDKWPDHTPDIGMGGWLLVMALVAVVVFGSLGWMFI